MRQASYLAVGLLASAAIGMGGWAAMAAERAPQPLTREALRLETVLARGCLPYLMGQKTEVEAMRGVALAHIHPLFGLEPGDTAPFWMSEFPTRLRVNTGQEVCNVALHGRDTEAYRAAVRRAIDLALAPDGADDGQSLYRQWVPGQVTGCRRGIRYTYYEDERRGFFSAELTRVDCARDPLRPAR